MLTIDYYFSVLSDWAYMGSDRFEHLARRYGAKINHLPMKLAGIYAGTGGKLLQKRSRQHQDYRVVELERWRDVLGIPITLHPRHYPTDDRISSCAIIAVKKAGGPTGRFANEILKAIWAEERDIADPDVIRTIAEGLGLDGKGVLAAAERSETAQEFDKYTAAAQEAGVFGSPFYIFEGELFWGQDRLQFLETKLARAADLPRTGLLIPPMQGATG